MFHLGSKVFPFLHTFNENYRFLLIFIFFIRFILVKLSNVSFVINKTHQGKSRIRGSIGSEFTDGLFRLLAIRIIFLPVFGPENTLYLLVSRIQFDGAACDKFVSRVNNPRKHNSIHIGTLLSVFIFID